MTCTEFQELLPDGLAREPADDEQAHLSSFPQGGLTTGEP
jgi:hypothetical protein